MKLFLKIYRRVFLGMAILSFGILFWLLFCFNRQSVQDAATYKLGALESGIKEFNIKMGQEKVRWAEAQVKRIMCVSIFRSVFGSEAALYEGDQELFNVTPYTFEVGRLRESVKRSDLNDYRAAASSPQQLDAGKAAADGSQPQGSRWLQLFVAENEGYTMVFYQDVTDIFDRTVRLLCQGLALTGLLLAAVGALLYRGIYRAIRPMIRLKRAAAAIAGGDYGSRVPLEGKDEIGELTESFNRMAEQVELHLEQLSETNERQRQLLGSLAHELKTPLTAIIGYADTLLTVKLSERNRVRALSYIQSEGRRLAGLSEKMLALTGLYESGASALVKGDIAVGALLERLAAVTSYRLQEKALRLVTACVPQGLRKEMDEDLVLSLLINLVDNAYKASEREGSIRVCADVDGITVEDSGSGIPKEDVERVTEAFYMVDKSRGRSAGGAGLGLALCSQIAALHGWSLAIESREGEGTRVSVRW